MSCRLYQVFNKQVNLLEHKTFMKIFTLKHKLVKEILIMRNRQYVVSTSLTL